MTVYLVAVENLYLPSNSVADLVRQDQMNTVIFNKMLQLYICKEFLAIHLLD